MKIHQNITCQKLVYSFFSDRTSWPAGLNDLALKNENDRYYLKAVSIEATTTLEEAK